MKELFEKFRHHKITEKALAFSRTPWYIGCLAVVAFLSHAFGLEYLAFIVFALAAIFTLVAGDDSTPLIPCAFFLFFSISRGNGAATDNDFGMISSLPFIITCVIMGALAVGAFVFHIIYYKKYVTFKTKTMLTSGFIALGLGLITNGIFSNTFTVLDLPIGLSFALLYYGVYFLIFHTIKWEKGFSMRYLAFIMFAMGLLITAEMGMLYIRDEALRTTFEKSLVYLGWAKSNSIAFVLLMPMVFGFYLTHTEKLSILYYLGVTAMLIAVIFTFSRGSLVIALPLFVAGTIFTCLFSRVRLPLWIAAGVLLILGIIALVAYRERLIVMLNFYIQTGMNDRGRFALWQEGWECFLSSPIFGGGLMYKFGGMGTFYWFHNTLVHFLATGGLIGLGTYVYHRVQTVIMFVRKPTLERFFAGMAILALLANGMLDVPMSLQYMLVIYSTILAFCEKDALHAIALSKQNKEKASE